MLQRFFTCGILLFAAATLDLALPVWLHHPASPSFLVLLLMLFCQSLRGAELVAWAGGVGLFWDYQTGEPPGVGIMSAATLALLVAAGKKSLEFPPGLMDRLLGGLVVLLPFFAIRGVQIFLCTDSVSIPAIASTLAGRGGSTFLLFVVANCLFWIVQLSRRRSWRLENSGL